MASHSCSTGSPSDTFRRFAKRAVRTGRWRGRKGPGWASRSALFELLDRREFLAADLVAHWSAEDLAGTVANGGTVTAWVDRVAGLVASAEGTPRLATTSLGGRAAVQFAAADGADAFKVAALNTPFADVQDFTATVVFATAATNLTGGNGNWYDNTGLLGSGAAGLARDWGISLNQAGQLSAGLGGGFGQPTVSAYSTTTGLNDGQAHIATITRQGTQLSLYVDDAPVVVQTGVDGAARARLDFYIGRLLASGQPFTGEIAEVRLYRGAMESGEVSILTDSLQTRYANAAPVPVDDRYVTDEDTSFFLIAAPGVLANDVDADGDPLTARVVTTTAHGSLALQPSGAFFYTPVGNFSGVDQFTYRAVDFRESLAVGTVTIEVRPKYDPARAVADSYKAVPGTPLVIDAQNGVLANDVNIDGGPLAALLVGNVSAGALTLNPDGSFTYDSQGFSGTATFQYQINDQTQLSPPTTVTLVVNSTPVGQEDHYEVLEDRVLAVPAASGLLANDIDPDGNPMSVIVTEVPIHGQLVVQPDGEFSYAPNPNYFGEDSFLYQVRDSVDISEPIRVQLTISPVNDLPQAGSDSYFALPGERLNVSATRGVLANDADVEGTPLTAQVEQLPLHGSLTLAADGSFVYQPAAGYVGEDRFTYRASDGAGSSPVTTVELTINGQPLLINELMASNATSLTTMQRAVATDEFVGETFTHDWIEIRNLVEQPLDLGGLHLTDDPRVPLKWQFPVGTEIPARGYLIVFASGNDIRDAGLDQRGYLHTNFQLTTAGEYLALTSVTGQPIHEFASGYPLQRTDISFGLNEQGATRYFSAPTPGAENGTGLVDLVGDTQFSVGRGFYDAPFTVEISTATLGAQIRYTTDGSLPSETNGNVYAGPLTIDRTTTLRARAFLDGWVPTNTDTQSYFFLNDVVNQTAETTRAAGFPATWRSNAADYGLDSENQLPLIAGDRNMSVDAAKEVIKSSLQAIPTLSIVMNIDDMFGTRGIYANPESGGSAWERATSVEMVHPDGSEGFQIDSGIRIQGGAFRGFGLTPKKSFRLLFKSKYGPGKLEYPLFDAEDAVQSFDTLTLRMESNDGWQWAGAGGQPQYARDEFGRRTQLAMGQPASHGTHVHLYINGMYWGLYNVVERPDESFGEAYFGADKYSWDGQNSGTAINSEGDSYRSRRTRDAWTSLTRLSREIRQATTEEERTVKYLALQGLNPDGTRNPELSKWIDPVNYADYLITNYYGGNADWPFKNYYFGRENSPDSDGFKFFMWDAEWSLLLNSKNGADLINDPSGAAAPFRDLRASAEFRLQFADRVQKHLFNGGALYVDPQNPNWDPAHPERNVPAARYAEIAERVFEPLIAESARWGDQHRATPYTRDVEWQREYDRIMTQWFPRRTFDLLQLFKTLSLFPQTAAPIFSQRGGQVAEGAGIVLSAAAGLIYYTTDGSDPRSVGGAVSPTARLFGEPIQVVDGMTIRTRALNGADWSAVDEATFAVGVVPAAPDNLRIAEVHYHPADPSSGELAAGFADADDFEFMELVNISQQTIDLSSVRFAQVINGADVQGVNFDFAGGMVQRLAPGARVVVVENLAAFQARYGDQIPVAGQWDGGLGNGGEMITLYAGESLLQQFTYADDWHARTDGHGPSLEVIDPAAADLSDWNRAAAWRPSFLPGGTPGTVGSLQLPGDSNGDGIFSSADLVIALQAGEYEDGIEDNSTFAEGDWDGDGDFTTRDIVLAFQFGNYVADDPPVAALPTGAVPTVDSAAKRNRDAILAVELALSTLESTWDDEDNLPLIP